MVVYADSSLIVSSYVPDAFSHKADKIILDLAHPIVFTPFHRHEIRNAFRLAVFRKQIVAEQKAVLLSQLEKDLRDHFFISTALSTSAVYHEAERIGALHTEGYGIRAADLLHIAAAIVLGAEKFLTFDKKQALVAQIEGLEVLS